MPDYLITILALSILNIISLTLAYNLGSRRTQPLNLRSAFRTLIEKRTSITSPYKRDTVNRALSSLSQ